jgi:hypothetical protein
MGLLVMLSQQILAVVVAVWRSHDDVDVNTTGNFGAGERNRRLMIELDQNDGTLNAVIEDGMLR